MKNYNDYSTEDFLQDESFRKWLESDGTVDGLFWEGFEKRFAEKANEFRLARSLYSSLKDMQPAADTGVKAKIWNNLQEVVSQSEGREQTKVRSLYGRWWMAAASLLIIGGLIWSQKSAFTGKPLGYARQVSRADEALTESVNSGSAEQTLRLQDGSVVRLKPGSKLSYSDFAGNQRLVYLDGEGYFDVAKDATKPFIVYAGHIVVQVIGTSFKVISGTGSLKSNVSVVSGKVKVFSAENGADSAAENQDAVVYLTPNQQVVFNASTKSFEKGLVAEPVQVNKKTDEQAFYFTNTSAIDILRELESAYGVKMRFNNASLESCKVTAPLGGLPMFRKLDIICQTIGATYEVFGTEIVISGGSCDL